MSNDQPGELKSIYIPTNGIQLHAVTSGPEDGPMVILLHGFPDFWYGWRNQILPLAREGYRVIVPDQRGYHLSEKPGPVSAYTIDQLAGDILGILAYYGREKVIIGGHDWGAAVAWYLGMQFPESVEKLIISNVPHLAAMNTALQRPVKTQLKKSSYIFYFQIPFFPEWMMKKDHFATLKQVLIQSSQPGTFTDSDLEQYEQAWSQPGALTGGMNWYRAMVRLRLQLGYKKFNAMFEHRITVPTLLLWGDQDSFLEPFLADWSMDWVDHGKLIRYSDAGHWVVQEKPAIISQEILQFIYSP